MNKLFTKIGTAMVGIAMAIGVGVAVGSKSAVEVKAGTSSTTANIRVGTEITSANETEVDVTGGTITVTHQQNNGTNAPLYNAAGMRLYYSSSDTTNRYGCSTILTFGGGITVTQIVVSGVSNYCPNISYKVDGGSATSGTWNSTTMTVSNLSSTVSFEFFNHHSSSTQLRYTQIAVTYTYTTADVHHLGISGTPELNYIMGDSFDPDGLTVKGYSSEEDLVGTDVTSSVEWSFNPSAFTTSGEQNVEVTASYSGKSKTETYTVNVAKKYFYKVTNVNDLIDGAEVVLVGITSENYYSMNKTVTSYKLGSVGITASEGKLIRNENTVSYTLIESSGNWYLHNDAGYFRGYISNSYYDLGLYATQSNAGQKWAFTFGESGIVTMKSDSNVYVAYNNQVFSASSTTSSTFYIYQECVGEPTFEKVVPSESELELYVGGDNGTFTINSYPLYASGTVTPVSGDEDIATVSIDGNTVTVVPVADGSTTITFKQGLTDLSGFVSVTCTEVVSYDSLRVGGNPTLTYLQGQTFSTSGVQVYGVKAGQDDTLLESGYTLSVSPETLSNIGTYNVRVTATYDADPENINGYHDFEVTVSEDTNSYYYKITNTNELVAGSKLLLVYEDTESTKYYTMGAWNGQRISGIEASYNSTRGALVFSNSMTVLNLGGKSGAWTLTTDAVSPIQLGYDVSGKFKTATTSDTWTISFDDGNAVIANTTTTSAKLFYNSNSTWFAPYTSSTMKKVCLYKYFSGDENSFASKFLSSTTCTASGLVAPVFAENTSVETFKVEYAALRNSARTALNTAATTHTDSYGADKVAEFGTRYYYIVLNHGVSYDFMGTFTDAQGNSTLGMNLQSISTNGMNTTIVVIITALVASSICGGAYFILRRRKKINN